MSKAESLKGLKQKVSTYSMKGFLKINTNHFTINTASFRKLHNIFTCSNYITNCSAFDIRTLAIMFGKTVSNLLAMAFEPILTSTLISEIGLQLDKYLLSSSFFSIKVMIASF